LKAEVQEDLDAQRESNFTTAVAALQEIINTNCTKFIFWNGY